MHHDRLKRRRSQTSLLQTSGLTSAPHQVCGSSRNLPHTLGEEFQTFRTPQPDSGQITGQNDGLLTTS